jgi:hypothetical protein
MWVAAFKKGPKTNPANRRIVVGRWRLFLLDINDSIKGFKGCAYN